MKAQKLISNNQFDFYLRRIWGYSATQTTDAAYLIGGFSVSLENKGGESDEVVRFKDDVWEKIGNLNFNRIFHLSITIGKETLIIGGYTRGQNGVTR